MAMKIAYVSTSKLPSRTANSIHVMNACDALCRLGYSVDLYGFIGNEELNDGLDLFGYYGIKSDFGVVLSPPTRNYNQKIRWYCQLVGVLWKKTYDLYYTRDLGAAAMFAFAGLPVIFESHKPVSGLLQLFLFKRIQTQPSLKAIVVISKALLQIMDKRGQVLDHSRFVVEHDGVTLEKFSDIAERELRRSVMTVGYFGHLYAGRGIEVILSLAKRLDNLEFYVIGGEERDILRIRSLIESEGINNVRLLGHLSNADLPTHLQNIDILLMPYQEETSVANVGNTSAFMSPLKMFEYLATGIPFVASEFDVLKEVLTDKENCLMVPPTDIQSWEIAVRSLVEDKELYAALSKTQKNTAQYYQWTERFKRILRKEYYEGDH